MKNEPMILNLFTHASIDISFSTNEIKIIQNFENI